MDSSVTFDDVKSNFTKDEQLSYFISNYGQLLYKGYITTENDGTGNRIEPIPNDQQAISEAIEHLKESVYCSAEGWRRDNSQLKRATALTLIDGHPTQANPIFGRMIQGIE